MNVRVLLPQVDPSPAPGTTAKVVFAAVARAEGSEAAPVASVRIPVSSIAQRGELSGVYVVQDGRLLLRQLRLGARSGTAVDVISGLKVGEVVARDPVAATAAIASQRRAAEGRRD